MIKNPKEVKVNSKKEGLDQLKKEMIDKFIENTEEVMSVQVILAEEGYSNPKEITVYGMKDCMKYIDYLDDNSDDDFKFKNPPHAKVVAMGLGVIVEHEENKFDPFEETAFVSKEDAIKTLTELRRTLEFLKVLKENMSEKKKEE